MPLSFYQWHLYTFRYFVHLKYNLTEAITFLKIKNITNISNFFPANTYNDIYFELLRPEWPTPCALLKNQINKYLNPNNKLSKNEKLFSGPVFQVFHVLF